MLNNKIIIEKFNALSFYFSIKFIYFFIDKEIGFYKRNYVLISELESLQEKYNKLDMEGKVDKDKLGEYIKKFNEMEEKIEGLNKDIKSKKILIYILIILSIILIVFILIIHIICIIINIIWLKYNFKHGKWIYKKKYFIYYTILSLCGFPFTIYLFYNLINT
mgnify:CR=1 FL=1